MKTLQHPNTFLCEKSNQEFAFDYLAKACEEFFPEPIPSKFQIDDEILCPSRYDGFLEATIEGFTTKYYNPFKDYNEEFWFRKGRYYTLRELAKTATFAENFIKTKEDIEICKDGSCTNLWHLTDVYLLKELEWRVTEPPKEVELFVKVFRKSEGHFDVAIFKSKGSVNTNYFDLIEWSYLPTE
jgi:hypothetical protein